MVKPTFYREGNPCVDEFWPLDMMSEEFKTRSVTLMMTWVGTNVLGIYVNTRCVLGIEFRRGVEPSFGLIWRNKSYGVWWPRD